MNNIIREISDTRPGAFMVLLAVVILAGAAYSAYYNSRYVDCIQALSSIEACEKLVYPERVAKRKELAAQWRARAKTLEGK